MSYSDIASLIAACAFAVLVLFLALPLWKLGRVFDQLKNTIKEVGEGANETVAEATNTVRGANAQLEKVDAITTSTAQVAQDISAISTLTSATLAKPMIKIAAFSAATRNLFNTVKSEVDRKKQPAKSESK